MLKENAVIVAISPEDFTVDEMVSVLEFTSDQYYNNTDDEGESYLTDTQWDALYRYLQLTDPVNKYLIGVGSTVRGNKAELPYNMPGLDQVHEGEVEKWIFGNSLQGEIFAVMDKMDGNSGMIVYDADGNIQVAFSRGSSTEGQDQTRHYRRMKNLPKTNVGNLKSSFAVRVEVEMKDEVFDKLNAKGLLRSRSGKPARNSRNYVSGQLNSTEAEQVFYDNVDVIAYQVMFPELDTKEEELEILENMGFTVAEYTMFNGFNINDDALIALLAERHEHSPFALDGLVLTVDSREVVTKLAPRKGSSLKPVHSRKFKVGQEDNVAIAEIVAIHRKVSKHGYIKPRVEIVPVDLVGVTITFATAFNESFLKKNSLGVGAKIKITRSGDVIPFIMEIVEPAPNGYEAPDVSEFGAYEWTAPNADGEQVDIVLIDADKSDDVILQKLIVFFSNLGVEFISTKSLEKLYEAGYTAPEDIINASVSNVQNVVGEANGRKGMQSLHEKLNSVDPWILAGVTHFFGRGIGRRKMKRVYEATGKIIGNTINELIKVEGIEQKSAEKIISGQKDFENFLTKINGRYTFTAKKEAVTGGAFDGEVVVFTGYRDADATAKIESMGGRIGSSVSSKTTLVVTKDPTSNSGKVKKAKDLGIKVIGPEELGGMIV